jgi:hypothetical protein
LKTDDSVSCKTNKVAISPINAKTNDWVYQIRPSKDKTPIITDEGSLFGTAIAHQTRRYAVLSKY